MHKISNTYTTTLKTATVYLSLKYLTPPNGRIDIKQFCSTDIVIIFILGGIDPKSQKQKLKTRKSWNSYILPSTGVWANMPWMVTTLRRTSDCGTGRNSGVGCWTCEECATQSHWETGSPAVLTGLSVSMATGTGARFSKLHKIFLSSS